jgi:CBS domain-containing protein
MMTSLIWNIRSSLPKLNLLRLLAPPSRKFHIQPFELSAKKDPSEPPSPTFKLTGTNNPDVRTILTQRTMDEPSSYLHVDVNSPVQEALRQMTQYHARALLVLDGQRVCGILTGRDYVRRVLAKGKLSTETKCGDIMSERLKCAALLSSLEECIGQMVEHDHHHLPVLNIIHVEDSQGKYFKKDILTILTAKDLMRAILSVYSNMAVSEKGEPFKNITMGTVLNEKGYNYIMARQEDSLEEVVQLMNERGIGSLLINEGTKITTGIVTENDFVRKSAIFEAKGLKHSPVKSIMTSNPICISPDFTLDQALMLLLERDFRHLPFIDFIGQSYDDDTRCLGLVSLTDILRFLGNKSISKLSKEYAKDPQTLGITGTRLSLPDEFIRVEPTEKYRTSKPPSSSH